ncbi:hypothetical protein [uncultured Pseudoteredinibacter sp.]|uniref:hypothetical protein n=1 Tax=uncultured Pseudoteredinibacter sp. TaxID=1641701 RepID=UPI00263606C1|nr:hypothetical protein [uncultured Pseudoteredinibacter sp.]
MRIFVFLIAITIGGCSTVHSSQLDFYLDRKYYGSGTEAIDLLSDVISTRENKDFILKNLYQTYQLSLGEVDIEKRDSALKSVKDAVYELGDPDFIKEFNNSAKKLERMPILPTSRVLDMSKYHLVTKGGDLNTGLYLGVNIGGKAYPFVVDTGSSNCLVPDLFLQESKAMRSGDVYYFDQVIIGDMDFSGMPCSKLSDHTSMRASYGILGLDFLMSVRTMCIVPSDHDKWSVLFGVSNCVADKKMMDLFYTDSLGLAGVGNFGQESGFYFIDSGADRSVIFKSGDEISLSKMKVTGARMFGAPDESIYISNNKRVFSTEMYSKAVYPHIVDEKISRRVFFGRPEKLSGYVGSDILLNSGALFIDFINMEIYVQ